MRRQNSKAPSAFFLFVEEWRQLRSNNLKWEECIQLAGPAWQKMSLAERQPYKHAARQLRPSTVSSEKISTNISGEGDLQRHMHVQIEKLVQNSVQHASVETQNYYFLMVNYFTKDVCTPAELTAVQFNLQKGLQDIYHTLINPGFGFYGSLYEAQEHARSTHQLPLPPNALGNADLDCIMADLLEFVRSQNDELPPVFTLQKLVPIVNQALKFLNRGSASQLKVYPIEYLFFTLKQTTCGIAMLPAPKSIRTTNLHFKQDPHEFLSEISCEFHNQCNLCKHCTKSYVTRWAYAFASYMCSDLVIEMVPYHHMPGLPGNTIEADQICQDNASAVHIKTEPITDGENQFNSDAIDALNNLDLDSIFEDDEFFGLQESPANQSPCGEPNHSEDTESIMEDNNLEIEEPIPDALTRQPPPPPSIPDCVKDDYAIYTRRPKQTEPKEMNQLIVNEIFSDPDNSSRINERIVQHQNSRSPINISMIDEKSQSSGNDRCPSVETETYRLYHEEPLSPRRNGRSPLRRGSISRSSSQSKDCDNFCQNKILSTEKNTRSPSQSKKTLSSSLLQRDNISSEKNRCDTQRVEHNPRFSRSSLKGPPTAKNDIKMRHVDDNHASSIEHSINPLKVRTSQYSIDNSQIRKRKASQPTISLINQHSGGVSPVFTADLLNKNISYEQPQIENKKEHINPNFINNAQEYPMSEIFETPIPPPQLILPNVGVHNSRGVVDYGPQQMPTLIQFQEGHIPYSDHPNQSFMSYDHRTPPSYHYKQLEPVIYQGHQFDQPNNYFHQRLAMANFNHLYQNDLSHHIERCFQPPTGTTMFAPEHYLPNQYNLSYWGSHQPAASNNEYGYFLSNNYH